jgi:hypothetical protein
MYHPVPVCYCRIVSINHYVHSRPNAKFTIQCYITVYQLEHLVITYLLPVIFVSVDIPSIVEVPGGLDARQLGWAGQQRQFTCVARGLPQPTISWQRAGQYLSGSDVYQVNTSRTDGQTTSTLQVCGCLLLCDSLRLGGHHEQLIFVIFSSAISTFCSM